MPQLGKHTAAVWDIPTMSSKPKPGRQPPSKAQQSDEDDGFEVEEVSDDSEGEDEEEQEPGDTSRTSDPAATPRGDAPSEPERPKTPAYVAPIGKIGPISPISPGIRAAPDRIQLPEYIGRFFVGKKVDEFGDIVDGESGQVLAHAGGDLPSIVGRAVSNAKGDILGDNGELLGYVEDLELGRTRSPKSPTAPRSLFELLGQSKASLMVDEHGNILDPSGQVVGKFRDNNNPLHRKEKEGEEAQSEEKQPEENKRKPSSGGEERAQPVRDEQAGEEEQRKPEPRPRRTESERRQNAESWRKENPGESPSDIFLDVKSTTEGIQLTIRIPTVFGGQQVKPNISFS